MPLTCCGTGSLTGSCSSTCTPTPLGRIRCTPEAALAGLLAAVGVDPRHLPEDLEGRASLWRDRMAGQRALLVLDNAASSAQVAPLLPGGAELPGAGHQPPAPR